MTPNYFVEKEYEQTEQLTNQRTLNMITHILHAFFTV